MTSFVFKCEGQIAIDSRLRLKTYTINVLGPVGIGWLGGCHYQTKTDNEPDTLQIVAVF